uniref:ATG11 domain-containing protein n=1 Tax=Mesocestoides corti TaxID=53468 RepID=A0A5K3EVP0_MESCO
MDLDFILSDFQKMIGCHADNIIIGLSSRKCEVLVAGEGPATHAKFGGVVKDLQSELRTIRKSSLKHLILSRLRECRRIIPFGKLRSWASDVMRAKSGGVPGKALTYATAAKCARLRRRLSRLFHLARASHAFTQRLNALQHPELARLQQDLMRIRLQLTVRLKQTRQEESDDDTGHLSQNPSHFSSRFEYLGQPVASGLTHEKISSRLESLTQNMSDLIVVLSNETTGLSKFIDAEEPFEREQLQTLVQRSLNSFCNFYSTSVAVDVGSAKEAASLAQLSRTDEELDDTSQSDTECMMDAFDVFDSFIDQNPSPPRPFELSGTSSASSSPPPSPPPSSPSSIDGKREESDAPMEESVAGVVKVDSGNNGVVDETGAETDEPPNPDSHPPVFSITAETFHSTPAKAPSVGTAEPIDEAAEVSAVGEEEEEDGEEEEEEEEEEHEEGEIVDDENMHHDVESMEEDEVVGDIDQTEQAIMREWAPETRNKLRPKVPYTTAVQKALDDATKSCQRELSTMVALGVSSHPSKSRPTEAHSAYLSPSVDRDIRGTVALVQTIFSKEMNSMLDKSTSSTSPSMGPVGQPSF